MSFALVSRRALAPVGGVATVATMSMAWTGERSVSQVAPRLAYKTGERAARNLYFRQPLLGQQRYNFSASAKPPHTTAETTAKTTEAATAKATTGVETKKTSGSFVEWYEGHLQSRPVVTKMFTGSFLWGLGDAVAQIVPQVSAKKEEKDMPVDFEYDAARTGRAVLYGFAMHAPVSHVHYNFLEWLTVRFGVKGLGIPVFKTIMEQFVYWGWVSNAMYLAAMGALQGHSATKIYDKIHDSLWGLMLAQWSFWIPVQLLNFQFVPVRHQLNVVLITSVVWTALLSFWYPPEMESNPESETVKLQKQKTRAIPMILDEVLEDDKKDKK